ncbi:MAG TPA: hypothetical protein VIK85_04945 [Coriobacteriia bacterium]
MATVDRQHDALQTIFSFFLGLMVVAFVIIGVNTFYPSPSDQVQLKVQPLQEQVNTLYSKNGTPTAADQAQIEALQKQINALQTGTYLTEQSWQLNTSIILIVLATLATGISLVRSEQLRVVSNGLLLGGLFTMLTGMGYSLASGTSYLRFFVVLFALAIAIGLGYAKFVWLRKGAAAPAVSSEGAVALPDVSGLAARVAALEAKTNAAAAALGRREGD